MWLQHLSSFATEVPTCSCTRTFFSKAWDDEVKSYQKLQKLIPWFSNQCNDHLTCGVRSLAHSWSLLRSFLLQQNQNRGLGLIRSCDRTFENKQSRWMVLQVEFWKLIQILNLCEWLFSYFQVPKSKLPTLHRHLYCKMSASCLYFIKFQ
jgi:hypothetical protein